MSLVNDALKRATAAQKNIPAEPRHYLPLRPAEAETHHKKGIGLVLPATLLTILVAAVFSFGFAKKSPPTAPASLVVETASVPSVVASPPPAVAPTPAVAVPESVAALVPANLPAAPAVLVLADNPPLAPLKLQAIFFTPGHPSAIISGKTVCVGDSVREMHVVAIGSASAMLVGTGQTNLLTLE